jgi:pyruvate dehydrogenase E2 component (dihydrolipoamide acetyltransferase)
MTELKQFRLPDVGEGLTEADIVSWHVQPGDKVAINQVIVEIETAKAVVELPCPFDGVVAQLLVDEGQTVDVGTPIIAVETSGGDSGSSPGAMPDHPAATSAAKPARIPDEGVVTLCRAARPQDSTRRCSSATASSPARRRGAHAGPPPGRARQPPETPPPPHPRHRPHRPLPVRETLTPGRQPLPRRMATRRGWRSRRCAGSPGISAST